MTGVLRAQVKFVKVYKGDLGGGLKSVKRLAGDNYIFSGAYTFAEVDSGREVVNYKVIKAE